MHNKQTNNTKQAVWIGIGSMMSFGFSIVSSMILSRYFGKADYGTYKQVLYVYDTLLVVFTLGLPSAYSYFLARVNITQSRNLILKISFIFLVMGLLMSASLFIFADKIGIILNNNDLPDAIRIFAIVPTLMLPTMGLDGILATFKKARTMAIYNILTKIFMLLCVALPVLLFDVDYKGALVGFVTASFVSFLIAEILIFYPLRNSGSEKCSVSYKNIFSFSLPLLYSSIFGTIQISSDSFFVSRYFGKEVFAEFANGNFDLPFVSMIIGACATVLSPVFSRLSSQDINPQTEILPIWKSVLEKSAILIYPIVLYSLFFADLIMVVLYGESYEISSIYFRIRILVSFVNVIAIGPLLINVGYVNSYSKVQMISSIAVVVLDLITVYTIHTPYMISIVQLLCRVLGALYLLYIIAGYFNTKISSLFPYKTIFKVIVCSLGVLIVLRIGIGLLSLNYFSLLLISLFAFCLSYYFLSKFVGIDYYKLIKSIKD